MTDTFEVGEVEYHRIEDECQLARRLAGDYRSKALIAMMPKVVGGKVLDVGSGRGTIPLYLKSLGNDVWSLEKSLKLYEKIKEDTKNAGIHAVIGDAREMPFEENTFDMVSVCDVIEHTEDDQQIICEAHTILKPGGILFLSVPAIPCLYGRRDRKHFHVKRYGKQDLRCLLEKYFEIQKMRYWNMTPIPIFILMEKILGIEVHEASKGNTLANKILTPILLAEAKIGVPIGLTLVAYAKKI